MIGEDQPVTLRAIRDRVLITDMDFGEIKTAGGIVLRSDNGKDHGIKPRWGKVYAIGPEQKDVKIGQWVLVEHGRWTRKVKIKDPEGIKEVQMIDTEAMLAVSDEAPTSEDSFIGDL